DRFIAVIYASIGEAGLIGHDELDVIFAGHVSRGHDGELTPVDARIKRDGTDDAARNGAAHRGPMPQAFALEIVYVARPAHEFVYTLFARDSRANNTGCCMRAHDSGCPKFRMG